MQMKLYRFCAVFLAILLFMGSFGAAPAEDTSGIRRIGRITGGSLRMREKPESDAEVIASYSNGTQVNIYGSSGSWYYVEINGRYGYMLSKYVETSLEYTHAGWAIGSSPDRIINLFSSPDPSSDILRKCVGETRFEVLDQSNGWIHVRSGLLFGYVQEDNLRMTDTDYSAVTCLTEGEMKFTLEAGQVRTNWHRAGSQKSLSTSIGNLACTIRYPVFVLGRIDAFFSSRIHEIMDFVSQDHTQYHSDKHAALDISYSSSKLNDRYASVTLLSVYTVDGLSPLSFIHSCMLDLEEDIIMDGTALLADPDAVRFQYDAKYSRVFGNMTGGYVSPQDLDLFSHAVLDENGLSFYFQAGEILPLDAGMQKITLPYLQCSSVLAISTPLISDGARQIDPEKPMLALTFDDGPSAETLRILDVLEKYGGRATFCVVGNRLNAFSNVLKCIAAQDNEIACHTWSHQKLTELSVKQIQSQLTRVNDLVFELTGKQVKVLRCPYGSFNSRVKKVCADLGMIIASWKVDTLDWSTRNTSKTYRSLIRESRSGYIVLMHDLYATTADAVIKAIPELVEQGYQLVTVSELFAYHKDGAVPGTVYMRLDPENLATE